MLWYEDEKLWQENSPRTIECDDCGTTYLPMTDAYQCPVCGTENYPED